MVDLDKQFYNPNSQVPERITISELMVSQRRLCTIQNRDSEGEEARRCGVKMDVCVCAHATQGSALAGTLKGLLTSWVPGGSLMYMKEREVLS